MHWFFGFVLVIDIDSNFIYFYHLLEDMQCARSPFAPGDLEIWIQHNCFQYILNASWLEFASARRRTTLILLKVPDGFQILWNSNFAALHFITAIATPLQPGKLSRCDFYWCGIDFLTSSQVFSHARIFDNPSQGCSLNAARGIWLAEPQRKAAANPLKQLRNVSLLQDTTSWDEKYNWAHSFLINRSVAACCREARGGGHWIMTCSGTALPGQTGYDGLYTRADEPHATCTLWHLDVVADVGPVGVLLSYRPCLSQRKAIHTRQTRASAHEASMVTFSRMGAKNIRNSWRHDLQRRTWPSAHFQTWSRRFFSKSSRVIDAINTKLKKQQTQGFQIVPRRKKHIGQLHEGDFGICTTKHSWIIFTMLDLLIFKASRTDFAPRSGSRCWH